jgi:hypothetical protein
LAAFKKFKPQSYLALWFILSNKIKHWIYVKMVKAFIFLKRIFPIYGRNLAKKYAARYVGIRNSRRGLIL